MSSSVIGALRVNLGLDSAQFKRGLSDAQKGLISARKEFIAVGAVATAIMGGITAAALRGASAIDDTAKAARRIDGSVAGYRALEMAADDAGVSVSSIANDVQTMNRELARAEMGDGNAGDALRAIGLAASDFAGLDADQRIALLADRVQELGLDSGKTTLLLRDLGIRNREMALLVMGGGAALRNARTDVNEFGLALADVDAQRIEAANDEIAGLADITTYLSDQLALKFVPAIGDMAKAMTDSLREGGLLRTVIDGLIGNLDNMAIVGAAVVAMFGARYVRALVGARSATVIFAASMQGLRASIAALMGPMGLVYLAIGSVAAAMITIRGSADDSASAMTSAESAASNLAIELDQIARTDLPNASKATVKLAKDNLTLARDSYAAARALVEVAKAAQQAAFNQTSMEDASLPGVENPGRAAYEAANAGLMASVEVLTAAEAELNARIAEGNSALGETVDLADRTSREMDGLGGSTSRASGGLRSVADSARDVITSLQDEIHAVGMSAEARRSLDAIRQAGVEANSEEARTIQSLVYELSGLEAQQQRNAEMGQAFESSSESAFVSFVTGAKNARAAAADLLSSLANMAASAAFRGLVGNLFAGGFGGGGLLPSFDGGGFTGFGSRAGGLDGKGGFMAMLHPNETVVDHTKGGMAGGAATLRIVAPEGFSVQQQGQIEGIAVQVVNTRTPKLVGGAFAQGYENRIPR